MRLTVDDLFMIKYIAWKHESLLQKNVIKGVSTDTRTLKADEVFIAIHGEKFDGHDFLNEAAAKGAVCAIVDDRWHDPSLNLPLIIVRDTVQALGQLARVYRRKFNIPVIAVTGSNGKTMTKDMITAVLKKRYNVMSTQGNFNNYIGVPTTLFRLKEENEIAVIEMGMSHQREIEYLCSMAEPTHGLITNIGKAHIGYLGSLKEIAEAKGELFEWLGEERKRIGFVNADDYLVYEQAEKLKQKITYGVHTKNVKTSGKIIDIDRQGYPTISIKTKGVSDVINVKVPILGTYNVLNVLAAATVGFEFGVKPDQIRSALESFRGPKSRMELKKVAGITIIDDSYNANPDSMRSALDALRVMQPKGKKIAVLSDMLELGEKTEREHQNIGKLIRKMEVDYLFTFGSHSELIYERADIKFKKHFDNKVILVRKLLSILSPGDIVLVKGSHRMKMDEVVEMIKERLKSSEGRSIKSKKK